MVAPNLFILGTHKAGVAFLNQTLAAHPKIVLTPSATPPLFSQDTVTDEDVAAFEAQHFAEAPQDAWVGEATTTYLQWPHVLPLFKTHIKKAPRFIVVLRQPTEKAVAFFLHNWQRNRYPASTPFMGTLDMKLGLSPFATGQYTSAIKGWQDAYPEASFCFVTTDQMQNEPQGTLRKITDFLDVAPLKDAPKTYQSGDPALVWEGSVLKPHTPLEGVFSQPEIQRYELTALHEKFAQGIDETAALTGLDLSDWHTLPQITQQKRAPRKSTAAKPRFVFHIGFPKCGSTAIFTSLRANMAQLTKQKVFVLGDTFDIATKASEMLNPLWEIQKARRSADVRANMEERLRTHIRQADPDSTLILSSEVLGELGGEGMFDGFDDIANVEVIGYFRPQISWIPSAWKQWQSRDGVTIQDATAHYIQTRNPDYLGSINRWKAALPNAKVTLRPFLREELKDQSPLHDFMTLIDFKYDTLETSSEVKNPSIDYALLHLMMLNHEMFFTSRHDSKMMHCLVGLLPPAYLKTNAIMLNTEMRTAITDHFRADNLEVLSQLMPASQVGPYFETYFTQPDIPHGTAYPDFAQDDILHRAQTILKEVFDIDVQDITDNGKALAVALRDTLNNHIET